MRGEDGFPFLSTISGPMRSPDTAGISNVSIALSVEHWLVRHEPTPYGLLRDVGRGLVAVRVPSSRGFEKVVFRPERMRLPSGSAARQLGDGDPSVTNGKGSVCPLGSAGRPLRRAERDGSSSGPVREDRCVAPRSSSRLSTRASVELLP